MAQPSNTSCTSREVVTVSLPRRRGPGRRRRCRARGWPWSGHAGSPRPVAGRAGCRRRGWCSFAGSRGGCCRPDRPGTARHPGARDDGRGGAVIVTAKDQQLAECVAQSTPRYGKVTRPRGAASPRAGRLAAPTRRVPPGTDVFARHTATANRLPVVVGVGQWPASPLGPVSTWQYA